MTLPTTLTAVFGLLGLPLLAAGCDVENPEEENEFEVITTVALTFSPQGGGADLVFSWADPELDGSPVVDDILLQDADDYDLAVSFRNELEDPAEDITVEVDAESDQHQVFFTGSAVDGPAADHPGAPIAQAYADTDANGLPVGLSSTIVTAAGGTGSLIVTLRHLPPEDDVPVKRADLAEEVAQGGFEAIGGETDAQVTFPLSVE
jgi:hypothetical protein